MCSSTSDPESAGHRKMFSLLCFKGEFDKCKNRHTVLNPATGVREGDVELGESYVRALKSGSLGG